MTSLKEPRPDDVFQVGTILNNTYEIKGLLGRGGTGEVYLAHHQIVDREMAVKVLNSVFSGNEDYLALMKREEQMRMIVHDAVVRYNECSRTDDGHVYLVMDYIEGPSLHDVMLERALSSDELLVVARHVLEGLVATHGQGIVHRDLSPDNIILRQARPEKATIIDFGIAKDTAADARTIVGNEFAGKYEYAAPEQLEGDATVRSDLYALGTSLLAALRRSIPNVGSSLGEIYRTKQEPLDLSDVPPELYGLLSHLTAPDPADRPQTAQEALSLLSGATSTDSVSASDAATVIVNPSKVNSGKGAQVGSGTTEAGKGGGGRLLPVLGGAALIAAIGGGLWVSGVLVPGPPLASPYVFAASLDDAGASVSGNVPSEEASVTLASAFARATGEAVPPDNLTIARGAPSDAWPDRLAMLAQMIARLETWSLEFQDTSGRLTGLAPDALLRDEVIARVEDWASASGARMSYDVLAGPRELPSETLQADLDQLGTCGALRQDAGPGAVYQLGDRVTVRGYLAQARDAEVLRLTLADIVGDRDLTLDTTVLNEDVCAIRAVLPPMSTDFEISLINGETGVVSEDGVFRTGENPVVDVELPVALEEGYLWVMVVDNTGKVFHVLPNAYDNQQELSLLGAVEGDMRRIRVLWSLEEVGENANRLAVEVIEGEYGKSEVIAILSREPLFQLRRPRDENIVSVAEALSSRLALREDLILGMSARTIESRP
ncbi:protein kinase domain-containing protein [Tropicimonas sp. S265A]|uniref:serine/threonine protein kinase n=1 Tax=Tropicimonas sp. S265A TaxID=3415134 RepID=UPI003C7BA9FA